MYSLSDLNEAFTFLRNSYSGEVQGCYTFDSGQSGPCVGICILTHGNEPTGLASFKFFLENKIFPERGKIIFVLNNVKAAEKYFNAKDEEEKEMCRFVDLNFNRLPANCLEIESNDYEIKRIQEIYPIYKCFDFGLDIHSTRSDPKPTIINISDDLSHGLFAGFPDNAVSIIANMANVQSGIPACSLFGGKNRVVPILGIETGKHEDLKSFETAIKCTIEFCINCGVLPKSDETRKPKSFMVYKVVQSVFFNDQSFETPREFSAFEELTEITVLGLNLKGDKIFSPRKGLSLFGTRKGFKPTTINDEVFFITDIPYMIEL